MLTDVFCLFKKKNSGTNGKYLKVKEQTPTLTLEKDMLASYAMNNDHASVLEASGALVRQLPKKALYSRRLHLSSASRVITSVDGDSLPQNGKGQPSLINS